VILYLGHLRLATRNTFARRDTCLCAQQGVSSTFLIHGK
jgi:hypothetical protein